MKIDSKNTVKLLLLILIVMAFIILIFTLGSLIRGKGHIYSAYRKPDPSPMTIEKPDEEKNENLVSYNKLGQLRIRTKSLKEGDSSILVLSPWFACRKDDTALFEELSQKDRMLKSIFMEYFASYTESQLRSMGEKQVKEELLSLINKELVLGKINALYFDEYMFIGNF